MGRWIGQAAAVFAALGVWTTTPAAAGPIATAVAETPDTSVATTAVTAETEVDTWEDRPRDRTRFLGLVAATAAEGLEERSLGEVAQAIAERLLGAKYEGGLLDRFEDERLALSLYEFDCVLFVETVMALARGAIVRDADYSNFARRVEALRYRDGRLQGYCSRLHYFTEWIADNAVRGNLQPLTLELGGRAQTKPLTFMSGHRHLYKHLAASDTNFQCIQAMEARLAAELTVNYIPTAAIASIYDDLEPGDIVAVATDIAGLDVTHSGLVYRYPDGRTGFIHASPAGETVIATDLQRYVANIDRAIGIMVARPL